MQCLHREVTMRWGVYPGRVAAGKITQGQMDREIGLMSAAAQTIEKMAKNGSFRTLYNAAAEARTYSHAELMQEIARVQIRANQLITDGNMASAQAECVKLAGLTLRLSELIGELLVKPQSDAPVVSAPDLALPATPATAAANSDYATVEQKTEIIRLLNHPAIERKEKTKVLLNINRISPDKATETIEHLNQLIDAYDGSTTYAKAS
ncbi:hypothetical protein [Hymenobacter rigui]|uniref:Uncharacterized protein n=1 Tax=Hymenobacter rigui TaxID=334424 RepID=A0A3R9NLU9_9BACT|nr:hypothetical protein [Hymenobacter rigui]RSK50070.1 hypothetical protein EI291_05315 [Hymenobacter rigui]